MRQNAGDRQAHECRRDFLERRIIDDIRNSEAQLIDGAVGEQLSNR